VSSPDCHEVLLPEAEKVSNMFGVDLEEYLKALTRPRVKVGNEWVNKGQNVDQVCRSVV
jgi:myosin protein heavy chain